MVPSDISEIVYFVLEVGEFCASFGFAKLYLYQIVLLQYHFPKHILTKSYILLRSHQSTLYYYNIKHSRQVKELHALEISTDEKNTGK